MKIARIELDTHSLLFFFGIGCVPGLICPLAVWLIRTMQGSELSGDFWLGMASSYVVAIFTGGLLMVWLQEGIYKVSEAEDVSQKRYQELSKTFASTQNDPVFAPPLREDGFEALKIVEGSRGKGGYCLVKPKHPEVPKMCRVEVFHHTDGFRDRQRELYKRIVDEFDSLWTSLYPDVNASYKDGISNGRDMAEGVTLNGIRIGKDEADSDLAYMLSLEYDQDEYVDVWVRGRKVTKTYFYM
jgi:hypothetical protein